MARIDDSSTLEGYDETAGVAGSSGGEAIHRVALFSKNCACELKSVGFSAPYRDRQDCYSLVGGTSGKKADRRRRPHHAKLILGTPQRCALNLLQVIAKPGRSASVPTTPLIEHQWLGIVVISLPAVRYARTSRDRQAHPVATVGRHVLAPRAAAGITSLSLSGDYPV